jgi:hypothetical protein
MKNIEKMIFKLPTHIDRGLYVSGSKKGKKKTPFALNMNVYRNTKHFMLNDMKHRFKELIYYQVEPYIGLKLKRFKIEYSITIGKKYKQFDIANTLSIVDKFFCDVLTEMEVVEDDSFQHLNEITFKFNKYEKNQSYVIAKVIDIGD